MASIKSGFLLFVLCIGLLSVTYAGDIFLFYPGENIFDLDLYTVSELEGKTRDIARYDHPFLEGKLVNMLNFRRRINLLFIYSL